MRAVILGDVDKTTTFFDGVLDELWLDIDDIDADQVIATANENSAQPDIIFLCDVDPDVVAKIKQFSSSIIFTLKNGNSHEWKWNWKHGVRSLSLHSTPQEAVRNIQEAIRSKIIKDQSEKTYEHNWCVLKDWRIQYSWWYIDLSPKEYMILTLLMDIPGKIIDRDTFVQYLGESVDTNARNIDSMVKRLRKKLRPVQQYLEIETIYGWGYAIQVPTEEFSHFEGNIKKSSLLYIPDRRQALIESEILNPTPFTHSESTIFQFMLEKMEQIITREQLLELILEEEVDMSTVDKRVMDSHIKRMRQKLWQWSNLISSEYGTWYKFDWEFLLAQTKLLKEKSNLYQKTPREIWWNINFEELLHVFWNPQFRWNYTYFGQTMQDGKIITLKIVRTSHPENFDIYQASGVKHVAPTLIGFYDAEKLFTWLEFSKVAKLDFIAFNESDESQWREHCPTELNTLLPISEIIKMLKHRVNTGNYMYYGKLKLTDPWPRAYLAIERTTDPKEPLIISVAILESRVQKKIISLTEKQALESFWASEFEKTNFVAAIFHQSAKRAQGKQMRVHCPPNSINGVRSISSILRVFENPAYSWEYSYVGILKDEEIELEGKKIYGGNVQISRSWNQLDLRILWYVRESRSTVYSEYAYTSKITRVYKISVEQLRKIGALKITKIHLIGGLKQDFKQRAEDLTNTWKKIEEVEVPIGTTFTEILPQIQDGNIPLEFKSFSLVRDKKSVRVLSYKSASGEVQFWVPNEENGTLITYTFGELRAFASQKKMKPYTKIFYLKEGSEVSLKDIETLMWKVIYKEVYVSFIFEEEQVFCRVEKKNGKIWYHKDENSYTPEDFRKTFKGKLSFQMLQKK